MAAAFKRLNQVNIWRTKEETTQQLMKLLCDLSIGHKTHWYYSKRKDSVIVSRSGKFKDSPTTIIDYPLKHRVVYFSDEPYRD